MREYLQCLFDKDGMRYTSGVVACASRANIMVNGTVSTRNGRMSGIFMFCQCNNLFRITRIVHRYAWRSMVTLYIFFYIFRSIVILQLLGWIEA